jgi:hypothetical protein
MTAFDYFPADEPLTEEPLFFVEPKDRDPASERERQARLVRRLRGMGLKVHATPNARQWGNKAWNDAKAEGVEWGAADLTINAPGGRTAYIEMKAGRTMPEGHQVRWLNARHKLGFPVAVCRTAAGALAFLRDNGFPVEVRDAA